MIETTWERAEAAEFPILWYRCYGSSLAVCKTYKKAETVNLPLFEFVGITLEMDDPKELVVIDGRQVYRMRFPTPRRLLLIVRSTVAACQRVSAGRLRLSRRLR